MVDYAPLQATNKNILKDESYYSIFLSKSRLDVQLFGFTEQLPVMWAVNYGIWPVSTSRQCVK